MVRVTHGKFTKAVSKKMRPAEEEEEEEEPESSEDGEYEESASEGSEEEDEDEDDEDLDEDDAEADADDAETAVKPKPDEDADEDAGIEAEPAEAAKSKKKKKKDKGAAKEKASKKEKSRKRNRFVDDVAEEDDDEDDEDGGGRAKKKKKSKEKKKKGSGAAAFIDDMADVEDDDEDGDESDGDAGDEELDEGEREAVELEAQRRIHARYENMENMERMENEEELERRLKERYAAHRDVMRDGDGIAEVVDQQALHPTVKDPKLWMVTVKQGKERETVVCLMQKAINLHKLGKGAMAIKSAAAQDHLKSYVYVEADREDHVKKALAGMRHVYHMKPIRLVPIKEMVDSITVTKKKVENVAIGSWIRMRGGVYKGDLGRVVDVNFADNQCTVKLVPRFDYAHLQAKEEGTAGGRAKKDSGMRPPARLFTEAEARKYNLSFERSRQDRRLGDVVDVLCGAHKLKDGYHVKTISLASCKLAETPALDELQRFAAGEDAEVGAGRAKGSGGDRSGGASAAEANLEALAASLGSQSGAKAPQRFLPGDQVVIAQGDLKNLQAVVERVNADGSVKVMPQHELLHEALDIDREHLRKSFKIGSHVRCVRGRHEGESGLVVKVEGEVATVFGDVAKEEFVVFSHHLADSAEATRRMESLGEYGVHDLAMLEDGSVGVVTRVEKDAAMLMMQGSTADRPDIRAAKLHDMRRKVSTRNISAVDAQMETIEPGSMCRIQEGPGKGLTLTVQHIWKGTLWGKARDVADHGGLIVAKARNCRVHGADRNKTAASATLVPRSPGSALLRSPARGGGGLDSNPAAAGGAPARGSFGGGRVGRRDSDLIGAVVKVGAGVYKGYKGKVVDATETTVRLELQAQSRTVTVQRSQLSGQGGGSSTAGGGGLGFSADGGYQPPDGAGVGAGYGAYAPPDLDADRLRSARTPMHGARTPMHYGAGSATPSRDLDGGRTPLHESSAWNPTTPRHEGFAGAGLASSGGGGGVGRGDHRGRRRGRRGRRVRSGRGRRGRRVHPGPHRRGVHGHARVSRRRRDAGARSRSRKIARRGGRRVPGALRHGRGGGLGGRSPRCGETARGRDRDDRCGVHPRRGAGRGRAARGAGRDRGDGAGGDAATGQAAEEGPRAGRRGGRAREERRAHRRRRRRRRAQDGRDQGHQHPRHRKPRARVGGVRR